MSLDKFENLQKVLSYPTGDLVTLSSRWLDSQDVGRSSVLVKNLGSIFLLYPNPPDAPDGLCPQATSEVVEIGRAPKAMLLTIVPFHLYKRHHRNHVECGPTTRFFKILSFGLTNK